MRELGTGTSREATAEPRKRTSDSKEQLLENASARDVRDPGAAGLKPGESSDPNPACCKACVPQSTSADWGFRDRLRRCDQPRNRRARQTERCPAQDEVNPLKGRTPRMPPGWNKPGRWEGKARRGRAGNRRTLDVLQGMVAWELPCVQMWSQDRAANSLSAEHRRGAEPHEGMSR